MLSPRGARGVEKAELNGNVDSDNNHRDSSRTYMYYIGSLVLSRKNFAFSASCRVSGKAMARTGLRMMPTFPSPPLKFRTASFPRYGFKAGISDKAFPKTWFAIVLRAHCFHRVLPALCQGRCAGKAPPCERPQPLYPRGPRSGPGYAVPVQSSLSRPHPPHSRAHPDFAAWRLIRDAIAVPIRIGLGNPRLVLSFP